MVLASIRDHVAKELALGGVNQGMRGQDGRNGRERAPRAEKNAAGKYFVPSSLRLAEATADCFLRQRG